MVQTYLALEVYFSAVRDGFYICLLATPAACTPLALHKYVTYARWQRPWIRTAKDKRVKAVLAIEYMKVNI